MANEQRLIDANALGIGIAKPEVFDNPAYAYGWNSAISIIENAPTVDAVPLEQYNELKERYKKLLETADILDTALGEYQRKYGE